MKLKKVLFSAIACALSLVFAFAACGEKTTVQLSETSITIGVGDVKRLTAEVSDKSEVSWTVSDESVATVTNGIVKGVGAGQTTVTATANGASATCAVTVENIIVEIDKTELTLDLEIEDQKSAKLNAVVKKNGTAIEEAVVWSTDNEGVATVKDGVVTAVSEGKATIMAKRASGNASATCEVTVDWKNKPAGYKTVDNYEQNKVPVNTWGYWNDQQNWVAGVVTADRAYTADSSDSEAGMAYFEFTTTSRDDSKGDLVASNYQIIYRSAGEGGKLETNYRYTLTLDITSNVAGEIAINNERIDSAGTEGDVYKKDLIAGKNTVTVDFNHYDDGTIYDSGNYTNIASAIFILPGKLGEVGETVKLTVDNIHWVKGEAVDPLPEATTPSTPAGQLPDLGDTPSIALDMATDNGKYALTKNDDGKAYDVVYTDVIGQTYENIVVDITGTNVLACNTFSVKIKNNGEKAMYIRFDIAGTSYDNGTNAASRDCALSSVASIGKPNTDTTWDGTQLQVAAGDETVLYITYDPDDGKHGAPTELLIYFDTLYVNNTDSSSGNVTLSEFKFANVEAKAGPANNMAFGQEKDDEWGNKGIEVDGNYYYWNDQNWAGATVTMSNYSYEEGKITLAYTCTAGGTDFAVQVFRKSDELTAGEEYTLSCKINVAVATKITLNGTDKELTAGDNEISVTFTAPNCTQAGEGLTFSIQIHASTQDGTAANTVVINNIAYALASAAD